MVRELKMDMTAQQLRDMMVDADPDKSGAIDFEEFFAVCKVQIESGNGGALAKVVRKASGFLSWFGMFDDSDVGEPVAVRADPPTPRVSRFEKRTFRLTKQAYSHSRPRGAQHVSSASNSVLSLMSDNDYDMQELQELLGDRDSPLVASVYARYRVTRDNLSKANRARIERILRDEEREENARQLYEEIQTRRARVRGRNEHAKEQLTRTNLEAGRAIRSQRNVHKKVLEKERQELEHKVKARVELANGGYANLDARLDAQEEAAAEALRRKHAKEKREFARAALALKQSIAQKNNEKAMSIRETTVRGLGQALSKAQASKVQEAQEKRIHSHEGHANFDLHERDYMARASAAKAFAVASRSNAARAKEELVLRKTREVQAEQRQAAWEVARNRERVLQANRMKRQAVFASRYASRTAALEYSGTTFQKLYMMDDAADEQIDAENQEILQRIAFVEQRTDDEIDDDAAGLARKKFAQRSRSQKAAERQRISRENAEQKRRLSRTQAVIMEVVNV